MSRYTLRQDDGVRGHLPKMLPLDGGMRHVGIVNHNDEVIATVWNHHDSQECSDLADLIAAILTAADVIAYRGKRWALSEFFDMTKATP